MIKKIFKIKYLLIFLVFALTLFSIFSEIGDLKKQQGTITQRSDVLIQENQKFRLFALELCQNSSDLSDYLLLNHDCSLLFSESELHKQDLNFGALFVDLVDQYIISRDRNATLTAEIFSLAQDKKQVSRDDYLETEVLQGGIKDLLNNQEMQKYLLEYNLKFSTSTVNILEIVKDDNIELRVFKEKWKEYLSLEIIGTQQKINLNAYPELLSIAKKNLASTSQTFDLEAFKQEAILTGGGEDNKNILLLGKNGGNVDTIMLASLNYTSKQITLISIPRDLFFESRKINSIYRYFGIETFVEKISEISGQKIANYVLIDMLVFPELVDALGGIDFVLEEPLIDPFYKTIDDGKEGTLYYPQGERHLSGVEALRVARSRYTTSDFSRAARQQQLIRTISDELHEQKKGDILFKYIPMFVDRVETDLSILRISKLFLDIKDFDIRIGSVISSGNILESKMYNLQSGKQMFILEPKETNWKLIEQYINREINKNN